VKERSENKLLGVKFFLLSTDGKHTQKNNLIQVLLPALVRREVMGYVAEK
jgi:hypothetical protein